MGNVDFSRFHIHTTVDGRDYLLIRPGVTLNLFVDEPVAIACAAAADVVESLLSWVPRGTFRSFLAKNGHYKPLTDRQIVKDLKYLRRLPAGYEGYELNYSEGELGQAGAYAVLVIAVPPSQSRPDVSNLIRLEFPEDVVDIWGEDRFVERVRQAAELVPFNSGYAGFALKRSKAFEIDAWTAMLPLLARYLGLDPSDHWLATRMRGCSVTAHWINLLGPRLSEQIGGMAAMKARVVNTPVTPLRDGVMLRGARFPPICDVNRGCTDVGELPRIAEMLRPVRCAKPRSGDRRFDAEAWLRRFDTVPVKSWDNREQPPV